MPLPDKIQLHVVVPAGLLLEETVEEVIAPGQEGYFGVRPGHTPLLASLGLGEISYRQGGQWRHLTCFWGFCEVLPERVNILAELGERAEQIDVSRAEAAKTQAAAQMKAIKEESGYAAAHEAYVRAVTRLAVARKQRG